MIATGVLDYALVPEAAEGDDDEDLLDEFDLTGAAT